MKCRLTCAASRTSSARAVVPPLDVTFARNVAGGSGLCCASAMLPANVA